MKYSREMLVDGIEKVDKLLNEHPIPAWEELPQLELYMDQVIILLGQYLGIYSIGNDADKFITAPMINNYVKLKIMPAPIKKKYTRIHLAYLIIICSLKQTLSMATIQKIIPIDLSDEEVIEIYKVFAKNQKKALKYTSDQIHQVACPIAEEAEHSPERINDLVIQVAISSNITKLLTEKLVDMNKAKETKEK